ncbi:class I adenylate-forming enzyme family protein [Acaryochloris marina]|uniref:class I adenylate-forming enzyme family protein n=1 Tax=Acaryochloris marina TaxID=155978 RepID=UPI001BB07E62|nr:AMP-binding protein [Acaryochloris marina]QUY44846.1 AMP-binding protein [Acaryochloris marina S15]
MLYNILKEVAIKNPNEIAIIYGETKITYNTLLEKISGLSEGLKSIGLKKGDCLALLLPNCPEFIFTFYAAMTLGAIILPLNHLFKAEEVEFYLQDSHAKYIITDSHRFQSCIQLISNLSNSVEVIVIDSTRTSSQSFSDLIKSNILDTRPIHIDPNSSAIYQYSSGSTGRPKRVTRTQSNLVSEVRSFGATTNITPTDKILCIVPLYHAHGLGNCLLASTCNGATLVILEPLMKNDLPVEVPFVFRCPRVLELIESKKITVLPAVPYIFSTMVETPVCTNANLNSLRLCFSAGNFLDQKTFDHFLNRYGVPIRQLYGCTEAGSISINLSTEVAQTAKSVGQSLLGVQVSIIDDNGKILPNGEIGEIIVKSQALTKGYDKMPELTSFAFQDGAYYTGDLGFLDQNRYLYITGRKKILIDTGGRKVDPIEIEDVLLTNPKIKEAVVVGVKSNLAGELIKAVVVLKNGIYYSEKEIQIFCRKYLADYKSPKMIEIRDEIPKSPLGKVLRKELI